MIKAMAGRILMAAALVCALAGPVRADDPAVFFHI